MTDLSPRPQTSALAEIRRRDSQCRCAAQRTASSRSDVGGSSWWSCCCSARGCWVWPCDGTPASRASTGWSLALAAVWAIGAFASGPLHLGGARWRGRNQRPVISGTVIGLLLGGVFVLGGLIAREIPAISELITRVLHYTDQGSWRLTMAVALLGGIAEELFYRGALYTALGRYHPALDLDDRLRGRNAGQRQSDARIRRHHLGNGVCSGTSRNRRGAGTDPDALRLDPGRTAGAAAAVRFVSRRNQLSVKSAVRRSWKALAPSRKSCDLSRTD